MRWPLLWKEASPGQGSFCNNDLLTWHYPVLITCLLVKKEVNKFDVNITWIKLIHGGTLAQGLALSTHSIWDRASLYGVCMFSCARVDFLQVLQFLPASKHVFRSISSQCPWPRYWLIIWSWSLGAALWLLTALLRDGLNAETKFHSICDQ